jgi:hypothetical protein
MLTVYIGYDEREKIAFDVCCYTLRKYASKPVNIVPLKLDKLKAQGLITRHTIGMHDVVSDAPFSTEFSVSRFLVPLIHQNGWAIFMDCDMIFADDIYKILPLLASQYAVMCVKHKHAGDEGIKMDNCIQTKYSRKNWSSFMAFNCGHPANRRLSIDDINRRPGRDLHAFYWLHDSEIGELPTGYNWLVDVQPMPEDLIVAHYTLGGPWFDNRPEGLHDYVWNAEKEEMLNGH